MVWVPFLTAVLWIGATTGWTPPLGSLPLRKSARPHSTLPIPGPLPSWPSRPALAHSQLRALGLSSDPPATHVRVRACPSLTLSPIAPLSTLWGTWRRCGPSVALSAHSGASTLDPLPPHPEIWDRVTVSPGRQSLSPLVANVMPL